MTKERVFNDSDQSVKIMNTLAKSPTMGLKNSSYV